MFAGATRPTKYLKLVRALRYLTLEEAVGLPVRVRSESSVVTDVVGALDSVLPRGLRALREPAVGLPTVVKYALLDLEFEFPSGGAMRLRRLSRQELAELGLLGRSGTGPSEDADTCIGQLLEEIATERPLLKVILDMVEDGRAPRRRVLPAVFQVRDCCVTNAPSIWLAKHFYL